jgi:hypothetical protein
MPNMRKTLTRGVGGRNVVAAATAAAAAAKENAEATKKMVNALNKNWATNHATAGQRLLPTSPRQGGGRRSYRKRNHKRKTQKQRR